MGFIMCLVEDGKGQVVNLALHNFVPLTDNVRAMADVVFNGQELTIKQPYLQVVVVVVTTVESSHFTKRMNIYPLCLYTYLYTLSCTHHTHIYRSVVTDL